MLPFQGSGRLRVSIGAVQRLFSVGWRRRRVVPDHRVATRGLAMSRLPAAPSSLSARSLRTAAIVPDDDLRQTGLLAGQHDVGWADDFRENDFRLRDIHRVNRNGGADQSTLTGNEGNPPARFDAGGNQRRLSGICLGGLSCRRRLVRRGRACAPAWLRTSASVGRSAQSRSWRSSPAGSTSSWRGDLRGIGTDFGRWLPSAADDRPAPA